MSDSKTPFCKNWRIRLAKQIWKLSLAESRSFQESAHSSDTSQQSYEDFKFPWRVEAIHYIRKESLEYNIIRIIGW